jgi:heme/copper-type cytochrome/quinol oxidase subunit 1
MIHNLSDLRVWLCGKLLVFGGFAGLIGSALSIIIRLELSAGGQVYL